MHPIKSFVSLIALCGLCFISSFVAGCGTTPATKLAQGEKVVITSVNVGVKQVVSAINAGKLTQKQCDSFRKYYTDYTDAQLLAKAAIEKLNASSAGATADDAQLANEAVNKAELTLLAFINSVIPR